MKFKREIITILIVICMLFTISSVCAADSEIQAISTQNSTDEFVGVVNDDEDLGMNDANEILAETDGGTIAELNNKIQTAIQNGESEVKLYNNYTYGTSESIITNTLQGKSNNGIGISDDLTIDGQSFTINGNNKGARIFSFFDDSKTITFKNVNFINCSDSLASSIFGICKDINLINCNFTNNRATSSGMGGAIYVKPTNVNIINCTFTNNYAYQYGGALYLQASGSSRIINSSFNGNEVGKNGGAIFYNSPNANFQTVIGRCIFINNNANQNAGSAIFSANNNGFYNLNDCIILNNTGTAIYLPDSSSNVEFNWWGHTSSNYDDDSLLSTTVGLSNWLYLDINSNQGVADVSLNNLYTYTVGTSTYADYDLPEIKVNITSTNAQINENNVTIDKTGKASITYQVPKNVGTLTASYNNIQLSKDVLYYDDGSFTALKNYIDGSNEGDEIILGNDYVVSDQKDSAIISHEGIDITKTLTINGNGQKINARSKTNLFNIYSDVTLKNIVFTNCVYDYGGVIYADSGKITIINCTFIGNSNPSYYAGGVMNAFTTPIDIINCTFINNTASWGSVASTDSNINFDKCVFINNTGGLVFCDGGTTIINNSIIINNDGNVFYGDNGATCLINNSWLGNTIDNYTDVPDVGSGVTINNWHVLDIDLTNHSATISLNNISDGNNINPSNNYDLPSITLNIKKDNVQLDDKTLDNDGKATIEFEELEKYSFIVGYNGFTFTKTFTQIGTFTQLKELIEGATDLEITLGMKYQYNSQKDSSLTKGIDFAKTITINGKGNIIDATGLSNIFYFDDDTNTKNLILKNIVFANATGTNGAAVFFKGNKIEITNCTFINNSAQSQGDAVYVANANGDNKINESLFINNTGSNSVVYVNLDSTEATLNLSDSIFIGNDAAYDVKATGNVVADYNWWGNTAENYNDANIAKVDGATLINWLVLNITANTDTNVATVSLDNLYDRNIVRVYENYALPSITVNIKGTNVTVQKSTVNLDNAGKAATALKLLKPDAVLTAGYEDIETSCEIHYVIVYDGSFKELNDIIRFSSENDVIELTKDYVYSDTDTITPGIWITKTITINGNDHIIDAKGNCGIFLINSPNVALNDITFKNGVLDGGGAVYGNQNAEVLTVDNCTFINNTATSSGGAIYSYVDNNMGSITNSKFIGNSAPNTGVIYNYGYYGEIDNCIFINNSGKYIVNHQYSYDYVSNSIFLNNTVSSYNIYGRTIYSWFGNTIDNYNTNIASSSATNWIFLNIKFYEGYAIVSLNNLYTKSSGATSVYSNYDLPEITLNINSTTLNLETDKITLDSNGQARVPYTKLSEDAKLTVSNEYVSLTKDVVVGDFYILQRLIDENDELELDRDYVYNGEDTITEGIVISKNITIDGKGHTIDAKEMTRIFNVQATGVTFKNIVFANGKSNLDWQSNKPNDGGAIYYNLDNNELIEFNVINCTFVNNTAKDITSKSFSGAAIYIKSNEGVYNIENSTFINNNAEGKGGAIYINTTDAEYNLYNSSFIGNKAYNDGALYIETEGTDIAIDKCLFRKNEAISTYYSSNGNAIIWNTSNDNGNSVVKNSVFLDNGRMKDNGQYTFLLVSGTVNIDDNWWGTTAINHPDTFNSFYVGGGITPSTWLFLNSDVSSDRLLYNETATIKYYLQLHDGTDITSFDNSKLHHVDFDVSCDVDGLNKDHVSLNEEFTYTANNTGNANVEIYCNNIAYEIFIHGPYMIPKVDVPFIIYANQGLAKKTLIKTANDYYSKVTITCNDSSLIDLNGNNDVNAHTKEGTAKLTFSYDGSYTSYPNAEDLEMVVKVVKVPLNITVKNLESNEITLNVTDTMDLDIAFEIDEIHKGYAPAWDTLDVKYNSSVISFSYDRGVRPENGSYYPTGHITAKIGGTTNLTIYCTSDKFAFENYTIKITVNKIPTDIELGSQDSFKVDDTSNVNAVFYNNGTQATAALIYESSDEDVVKFTSNIGDFKAVANGTAVLSVRFAGNRTHEASSKSLTVTVTKYSTTTTVTSDKELSLKVGGESQITATLTAEDGEDLALAYESSDDSVATVDSTGKITAVGEGTAVITAKYGETVKYAGSNDSVTVIVSRTETAITAQDMEIWATDENVGIGATLNITGDYTLTYSSNDTENAVLTLTQDGLITSITEGKVNITISYAGNGTYLPSQKSIIVTVKKVQAVIDEIDPISTKYNSQIAITPTVSSNGGNITYFIGETQISQDLNLGETFTFTVDRVGKFNITAKYNGNSKYLPAERNITIDSDKADNIIKVVVDDASYPDNITIKLNATVAGTYSVDINGTVYDVVANGTGRSVKLAAGSYYANITGYESEYYYGRTTNDTFTVEKDTNNVHVIVENKYLPGAATIKVTADIGGIYRVVLNDTAGTEVLVEVTGGEGSNTISLPAGKYQANTTFADYQNYTVIITNATFDVLKSDNHITVNVEDGTYPNNVTVTVTADVDGTYSVDINGTVHEIAANGEGKSIKLAAGSYYANITGYSSDDYIGVTANDTFTIAKAVNNVNVIVNDKYLPGDVTVRITAGVDGIYTVEVNGTEVDVNVEAGQGTNTISLPAGVKYEAKTTFADHQNYTVSITNATFDVNRSDILLEIIINEIIYGNNVTGTINTNVSGTYTLKIADADPFEVDLNIGHNTFTHEIMLPVATGYHAEVSIAESDNYNAKSAETTFEVDQTGTDFNASSSKEEYVYGEDIILEIELPDDATGNVTFRYVDESYIGEISDVTQTKEFKMPIVRAYEYSIQARYNGDNNYKPRTQTINFNVVPAVNHISVTVDDVTYPNVATVKVTADVEGIYTIDINGKPYEVVANGEGKYVKLAAGSYYANIKYSNENYTAVTQNDTFTVNKGINVVIVNVDDVDLPGDVTVRVTATLAGTYEIDINGTKVNVTVESNGVGTNVTSLAAGNGYLAKISKAGDENYTALITNATFNILKSDNNIIVSVEDVTYPGEVTVKVTADIDGTYTVDINGTEHEIVANGAGKAIKLASGSYYANVTGYSSPYYNGIITNETFTVSKKENKVNVTFEDTVLPGDVTVNVESDTDGIYTIDINGTEVTVNVESGFGTNTVSLSAGKNYTASVTYSDSQNYTLTVDAKSFNVEKSKNRINVTVESVDYPNEVIINVTADIAGTYTVDINGTEYDVIANGTGKSVKLAAGIYSANITGYASDDYIGVITNATFTVNRISPQISADNLEIDAKGNKTIAVNNKPSDAALTFESSDESIAIVDGNGKVTAVKSGTATITVSSTGSQNYSDESIEVTVTVNKISAGIDVGESSFEINVGENNTINVIKPSDYDGNITFESSNSSVAAVDAEGKVTGITGGSATITVKANGSEVYDDDAKEVTVTVNKISAGITVDEISFEIDVNANKTIIVNKGEFDGTISFESNDTSVATVDGDGNVIGIVGGTATIIVNVTGSDRYNDESLEVTVKVNIISPNLDAADVVVDVDASERISIQIPGDYDGKITYEISNSSIATVENGIVKGIIGGNATITITVNESAKYSDDSIEINVTVNKILSNGITVVPDNLEIDVFDSKDFTVSDYYERELTYAVENESIATIEVDATGVTVTGVSGGIVNITVTAAETDKYLAESKNVTVTVNKITEGIEVEDSLEVDVYANKSIIMDKHNFDGDIAFESNDTSVATVDGNGVVTGIKAGKAIITITATNSSKFNDEILNVNVTVNRISPELNVNPASIELAAGKNATVSVTADDNYDGEVTFTVNDTSVATIENGVITAVKGGTVLITVEASETEKFTNESAAITVTVTKLAYPITLDISDITAGENASAIITTSDAGSINVTLTKGLDIIKSEVIDINGYCKYVVSDLRVGTYSISARFDGNEWYNESEITKEFSIKPIYNYEFAVNVNDTVIGQTTNATVTLPADATGILVIDGKEVEINSTIALPVQSVAGKNNVTVKYVPDEESDYAPGEFTAYYNVAKKDAEISIDVGEVEIGKDVEITVVSYDGAVIAVSVDGASQTLTDNKFKIKATAGVHTVIATVAESDEYLAASANRTFEVTKLTPTLTVNASDVKVGEKLRIDINITDLASGMVIVNVNGTNHTVYLDSSKSMELILDVAGKYDIAAKYLGDDIYNAVESDKITVEATEKAESGINVEIPSNIKVGDIVAINVTSPNDEIEVLINGIAQDVKDGKVEFEVANAGAYTIVVNANETADFKAQAYIGSFSAEKNAAEVEIVLPQSIEIGNDIEIIVRSYDGADITVSFDGASQTLTDNRFTVKATAGVHTVTAGIGETDKYLKATANETFTVLKLDSQITISASDVKVGEKTVIDIIITDSATGIVSVIVNGTEYLVNLENAKSVEVVLNKSGKYDIAARYMGDDIYNQAQSNNVTVEATEKAESNINVEIPSDVKVGLTIVINVTSDNDNIEVFINGTVQEIRNGKVEYEVTQAGSYPIVVKATETGDYKAQTYETSFTAAKNEATVEINIGDIEIGSDIEITVSSYDCADIKLFVDGVAQTLIYNKAYVKATAGNHTVTASVAESDRYLAASSNATYEVVKKTPQIALTGVDVRVGEKTTISIMSPDFITGIVIVNVNGTDYTVNLDSAKSVEVSLDNVGNYTVRARYLGDEIYSEAESESITVEAGAKEPSNLEVEIPKDIRVGDVIIIKVTSDNDDLEVLINGTAQDVINGKVQYEVTAAGTYPVVVKASETAEFAEQTYIGAFTADKNQASVEIILPESIEIGKDIEIAVKSYENADIKAYVDGKAQSIKDNKFTIKATAGVHTIIAGVDETDKYNKATANATFAVDKLESEISVEAADTKVGEKTTVTVRVTENATGIVIVTVGSDEYSIRIENATSVDVVMNQAGTFNVSARYLGDDIFNASESSVMTIEVAEKETPSVNVTIPEIKAGDDGNISLNIANATGTVYIIVDGVAEVAQLDENGTAVIPVDEMKAGNHTITVIYAGDENNEMTIKSQSFNIPKKDCAVNVAVTEIGNNSQIEVSVPNATGSVSVIIDGVETIVPLDENGTAVVPIDVAGGEHSVVVAYSGDDTHASVLNVTTFNTPVLGSEFINLTVSGDLVVTGVLANSFGDPIANATISYVVGSNSGNLTTGKDGSFTIAGESNAEMSIDYAGTKDILGSNITIKLGDIASAKLATQFNVTEGISIKTYAVDSKAGEIGQTTAFRLTDSDGNPVANATVKFAYKTVILNRTTDENGIVFIGINTQFAQEALCAMSYLGDEKHNASFVAFSFDIQKKPITISAAAKSYKVTAKTKKYTVTLKTQKCNSRDGKVYLSAGKKVTLKINGKTYTAKTNSKGQATFSLKITKKGKFTTKISFAGDKTYKSASKKVIITIK